VVIIGAAQREHPPGTLDLVLGKPIHSRGCFAVLEFNREAPAFLNLVQYLREYFQTVRHSRNPDRLAHAATPRFQHATGAASQNIKGDR
jgi:hypothetical protein